MNVLLKQRERAEDVPANAIPFDFGEVLSGDYDYITESGTEMEVVSIEIAPRRGDVSVYAKAKHGDWATDTPILFDGRGYQREDATIGDLLMVPKPEKAPTREVTEIATLIRGVAYALERRPDTPRIEVAKQLTALAIEIMDKVEYKER